MTVTLRMKCPYCGKWNNIKAEKVMMELDNKEPKDAGLSTNLLTAQD